MVLKEEIVNFLNTGSFEVIIGGEVVYSKLREGRMPSKELVNFIVIDPRTCKETI